MLIWFLLVSTSLLLVGGLAGSGLLMAIAGVGLIAGMAALGGAPRGPVLLFWVWVSGVLAYLAASTPAADPAADFIFGLPPAAFWTLFGVWIVPAAIWPLAFALRFRDWIGR